MSTKTKKTRLGLTVASLGGAAFFLSACSVVPVYSTGYGPAQYYQPVDPYCCAYVPYYTYTPGLVYKDYRHHDNRGFVPPGPGPQGEFRRDVPVHSPGFAPRPLPPQASHFQVGSGVRRP